MHEDIYNIFIDRLRQGETESIDVEVPPDFMGVSEDELRFSSPVKVRGQAYLAGQELIVDLEVSTFAELLCIICRKSVHYPIQIEKMMITLPLSEVPSHIYDWRQAVREELLLATPSFVECSDGVCPDREVMKKYLK